MFIDFRIIILSGLRFLPLIINTSYHKKNYLKHLFVIQ